MSGLPDFIPTTEPKQTVTDLSGKLTAAQLSELNGLDSRLQYKARVLIMPSSYKASSDQELRDLGDEIGRTWQIEGSTLLMLVDLSGRKIRLVAGPEMAHTGVSNYYLQKTLLPEYFYPQVKVGHVYEAITNSLIAIDGRRQSFQQQPLRSRTDLSGVSSNTGTYERHSNSNANPNLSAPPGSGSDYGTIFLAGALVVLGSACFLLKSRSDREKNKSRTQDLMDRLGKLYKLADELGQASEYMPPGENKDLALQVSAFFQKLETVNKAKDEIDKLSLEKRWGKANDALLSGLKLTNALTAEGEKLLAQVSAITGGVDSLKPDSAEQTTADTKAPPSDNDAPHKVRVDMPYSRPSWSYEPEYNQPIFVNSGPSTGIMDMLFLLNSMNYGNIFDSGNSYNYSDTSYSSGTDSSPSSDFTVDTGGSWTDNSSSFDSGSFDSGSSDSGGSDSGSSGSW